MVPSRGKSNFGLSLWTYAERSPELDPFAALAAAAEKEAPERPLQGTWRDALAQVYDALAQRGIVVGSYDECELWEVAAMCGANRAPEPDQPEEAMGDFRAV